MYVCVRVDHMCTYVDCRRMNTPQTHKNNNQPTPPTCIVVLEDRGPSFPSPSTTAPSSTSATSAAAASTATSAGVDARDEEESETVPSGPYHYFSCGV